MKNTAKSILALSLILTVFLAPKAASAQNYNVPQNKYSISVVKKLSDLTDKNYYNNIPASQKVFGEGDQIDFQITIENTGDNTLDNVKMRDSLPKYLDLILYPGSFDKNSNQITAEIGTLDVGQTKVINIRGKIANVPTSKTAGVNLKQTNTVTAFNDKASDTSQASYFIAEKSVPTTGNELFLFQTGIGISLAGIALKLRRLIRGF